MSGGQNRVDVEIYGERYTLVGDTSQEGMIKLSLEVDQKMKLVLQRNSRLTLYKAAILVALNLAEELYNLREEHQDLLDMLENDQKKRKKK